MSARGSFRSSVRPRVLFTSADVDVLTLLFVADYFCDACYQALAYWIMSAISNDPFKLARYAGLYKAMQSAGSAGSFGMDAVLTPLLNEHLASWIMMLVSFPLAFLVIRTIKETTYEEEKVVYVDDAQKEEILRGEVIEVSATDSIDDEKGSVTKEIV